MRTIIIVSLAIYLTSCDARDPRAKNNWPPAPSMKQAAYEAQLEQAAELEEVAAADVN